MRITRTHCLLTLASLTFISRSLAADPASQPAATAEDEAKIEAILDRQEARGKDLKDIECKLEYIKEDEVLKDKQTLKGTLVFKVAEPNPHFLIEFQEGRPPKTNEWHVFDGRWYIEARTSTQSITKHEILRPGEKKNVFKLGEGPFPVPFGQKKKDIVDTFKIQLVPPASNDPPNTDHLECTPKPGNDIARRYGTVHFWIDRTLGLPVKLTTVQKEEDQSITAIFTNLKINTGIAGSRLELPPLPTYQIIEDRLPAPGEKSNDIEKSK